MLRRRARAILSFCWACCLTSGLQAQPLPASTFGKLPPIADVALSPDGSRAVVLQAQFDTYHAVVLDFKTRSSRLVMAADPEQFLFNWCRFANPDRVVCSIRSYIELRAGQTSGVGFRRYRDGRTVITRLLAVDADGGNPLQLVPSAVSRVGRQLVWNATDQDTVVSWLHDDAEHILLQIARDDRLRPSLYRLNIYDNRLTRVRRHHDSVLRWYADPVGRVGLAVGRLQNLEPVAFRVDRNRLARVEAAHLAGVGEPRPLALTADGDHVWLLANNGADTVGLHRMRLADGEVVDTRVQLADYDIRGVGLHPQTGEPLFATYASMDTEYVWFDEKLRRDLAAIQTALPGKPGLQVRDWSRDLRSIALFVEGDNHDPAYYVYDRADRALRKLAQWRHGPPIQFEFLRYDARDGLSIPAYLALPDVAEKGPYALVIYPHGGPYARDTARADFVSRMLLNRGYAVFKPNYRGSAGYGDEFMAAGFGQWGMKMQDDLMDGLDWLVARGLVDAKRVCMVGGSYGGYAALVAAFKSPERFRCAVSFAGITDLSELVKRLYNFQFGELTIARVQDGPEREAYSPLQQVERIGVPLLIVHGDVDRRVMVEQSRELVAALEQAGKPHVYIEQANGDHFLSLESHRIEYLEALDAFLSDHLGE